MASSLKATMVFGMIAAAVGFAGCAKSDSGGTASGAPAIASVSSLPKSTGKVTTASGVRVGRLKGEDSLKATTGMKIATFDDVSWDSKSRGLCEMGQVIRDSYREAGNPDKIMCYVGVMEKYKLFAGAGTYELGGVGEGDAGGGKIKYATTKDADGNFTNFKLWSCMQDGLKQDNYVEINLAATTTVKSVSKFELDMEDTDLDLTMKGTFASRTVGEGTVDSTGAWTKKTVTSDNKSTMTMDLATLNMVFAMSQHSAINEYSDAFDVNAYWLGSMTSGTTKATWSDTGKGMIQRINADDELRSLALGDGSVKFKIDYDWYISDVRYADYSSTLDGVASWSGDTFLDLEKPSTGDYYAKVSEATLTTAVAVEDTTVAFTTDETWDCSGTATLVDFTSAATLATLASNADAFTAEFAECDDDFAMAESEWVDCKAADADLTEDSE